MWGSSMGSVPECTQFAPASASRHSPGILDTCRSKVTYPVVCGSVSLFLDSIQGFGLGSSWGRGEFYDSWRGSKRLRLAMASDSTVDLHK